MYKRMDFASVLGLLYNHISVGSALLVQLYWAMWKPLGVERATKLDFHAFLYSYLINLLFTSMSGSRIGKKNYSL